MPHPIIIRKTQTGHRLIVGTLPIELTGTTNSRARNHACQTLIYIAKLEKAAQRQAA